MGYDAGMDMRKATDIVSSHPGHDWGSEDWTAEDIAACAEAEAAVARGEWIDGDIMMARLDDMVKYFRAKAAKQR